MRLAEESESATVNMAVYSYIKTRLAHLCYKPIVQLASMVLDIELKSPLPEKICGGCIVGK